METSDTAGKPYLGVHQTGSSSDDDKFHCVGRDITDQRAQAEEVRALEASLRQSQKMEAVGQLTGGIAHDFNNMLTGVIGGLEMIQRRLGAGRYDEVGRFVDAARECSARAASLVNRLMAFSRQQPLKGKRSGDDIWRLGAVL